MSAVSCFYCGSSTTTLTRLGVRRKGEEQLYRCSREACQEEKKTRVQRAMKSVSHHRLRALYRLVP